MYKTMAALMVVLCLCSGFTVYGQGLQTTATSQSWEEINFEFNSSVLVDGYPSLLRLAELLKQHPEYKVRLEGNADWIGSDQYNDKLALARAETVKSFLVLKPGMTATAEEIQAYCKEQLAAYKVPRAVEFRPELPKSPVLKILRRELREQELAKGN